MERERGGKGEEGINGLMMFLMEPIIHFGGSSRC